MAEGAQVEVIQQRVEDVSDRESHSGSEAGVSKDKSISQKLLFWKTDSNTRRPPDNKWLQQQIPACRPVFTAVSVFFGFVIIGVAFIIIGVVFTIFSSGLREFRVYYEDCPPLATDDPSVREFDTCEDYLLNISSLSNFERRYRPDCHCSRSFRLEQELRSPWNFYYGLDNFYQNHRRYLNSLDVTQLRGSGFTSPASECRPIVRINVNSTVTNVPVVPCGLIGNSFFNDSFDSFTSENNGTTVTLDRTDIAWPTDRSIRFRNPDQSFNISEPQLDGTVMPPNWPRDLSEIGRGLQNESLMVWYRVAAFPWFKKLYGRPLVDQSRSASLPAGSYDIILTYNFPVGPFNGRKSIVMSEVSWLGGRNHFLGIAYLVMGAILIVSAIILILTHFFFSKWKVRNFQL